jgi:hypothetical protein
VFGSSFDFEVFDLLQEGGTGLPDPTSVLPFWGLYTLVALKPLNKLLPHEQELVITSPHLPKLSLIQDNHFDIAPPGTSPHAHSAARIFDVMALRDTTPTFKPGQIPLFPSHPDYGHSRFWRLPINPGVVLSVMLQHLPTAPLNDVGIALTMHLSGLLSIVAARRMLNATGLTSVISSAQYDAGSAGGLSKGVGNEVRQSAERNTGEAKGNHDGSTTGASGEFDYGLGNWVDEPDTGSNQLSKLSLHYSLTA